MNILIVEDEYKELLFLTNFIRRTFPDAYELLIKGKLFELFFQLYHHGLVSTPVFADPTHRCLREKALEKSRQILKYVEQHYQEPLSIEKLAKTIGFSQSHFMKFFKASFGTSFVSYLKEYRLTKAARLLVSSSGSVLTIAQETGFDNLSYFNRSFKEMYGVTPRQFREGG